MGGASRSGLNERSSVDLQPTDEQRLVIDTFRAFFGKESSAEAVRAADKTGGHDARLWAGFGALGGPLLSLPESVGGGGGSLLDAVLVGLEAGRRLAPIAYTDAVVAARTLGRLSGVAWNDLPVGESPLAWAPAWAGDVTAAGGRLSGRLRWTRAGATAAWLAVDLGPALALMDLEGLGIERRPLSNLGCFPMAEIVLDGAPAAGLWPWGDDECRRTRAEARVLASAELVGAGRQALQLARDHVLDRRQFDRPIASFQAIQHRLADRHTALEAAELLVLRAASHGADDDVGRFGFASAVALLRAAEAAELAAKEALQFHGGYGFTLEYDVHLYLRYAKTLAVLARDPDLVDDALPVMA
jgi:alkylation response protein AidB-like acyl-CoA dehydrogenase